MIIGQLLTEYFYDAFASVFNPKPVIKNQLGAVLLDRSRKYLWISNNNNAKSPTAITLPPDRTFFELTLVTERANTDYLHFYIGASCFGYPQSPELPIRFPLTPLVVDLPFRKFSTLKAHR